MPEEKQKPVKQFKAGALGVSIWRRENNGEVFYSATPSRAYLDKKDTSEGSEGTWKYSDSLNRDDLPVIAALLNQAFSWIVAQQSVK